MNSETISKIKSKMTGELLPAQMNKLEEVLLQILAEESNCKTKPKDGKNLVRQFISAKRIEAAQRGQKNTISIPLNSLKRT